MLETILIPARLQGSSGTLLPLNSLTATVLLVVLSAALLTVSIIALYLWLRLQEIRKQSTCLAVGLACRGQAENHRLTELLRTIVATTTDAVFVKDREGKYVMANEATGQFVGKPLNQIIGADDRELFALPHAEFLIERDQQLMAAGTTETSEEELNAAGVTRTYLAMKAPYRNQRGEVIGLVGISRDITERKQAEKALQQSEQSLRLSQERLAHAQEIAGLGVWCWEADSDHLYWSRECYKRFGLSPESTIPSVQLFMSLLHPEDRQGVVECVHDMQTGTIDQFQRDLRVVRSDGSIVWIHVVSRAVRDQHGKLIRIDGIDQDITQRKAIEQELRQAQKMEAVARLAGGIAHDFNNLLTVIKGYCELLLSGSHLRGMPGVNLLDSLREIRDAGDRAARLTGQLLAFSRRAIMQPRLLDLSETVRSALPLVERLVDQQITLHLELSDQLPMITVDPLQLEQVVVNLVINARDAMPEGGQLTIRTSERSFERDEEFLGRLIRSGQYAVLSVRDTGIGIPAGYETKVFEPFFSTKVESQATGLGLSVAHGVVTECDGYIVYESLPQGGTTFHLLWPTVSWAAIER